MRKETEKNDNSKYENTEASGTVLSDYNQNLSTSEGRKETNEYL